MKKLIFAAVALFVCVSPVCAAASGDWSDDRPIKYAELPAEAKAFVDEYFAKEKVSHVIRDRDVLSTDYKVVFVSGAKVEFDGSGKWTEVDCRYTKVPEKIVPQAIRSYVKESYPEGTIIEIKRDRWEWEVKLTGGLELTFNNEFRLTDIDD